LAAPWKNITSPQARRARYSTAEYVKVLRHYDVPFEDAMVMGFRQYRIEDYSPLAKQLFREVGGILGARKKRRAA
jgi:hypothetical protein